MKKAIYILDIAQAQVGDVVSYKGITQTIVELHYHPHYKNLETITTDKNHIKSWSTIHTSDKSKSTWAKEEGYYQECLQSGNVIHINI
jgi:NMD protein affecting ribosome stability and mRNA decay